MDIELKLIPEQNLDGTNLPKQTTVNPELSVVAVLPGKNKDPLNNTPPVFGIRMVAPKGGDMAILFTADKGERLIADLIRALRRIQGNPAIDA